MSHLVCFELTLDFIVPCFVQRADTETLKDLEAEKRKTYTALCITDTEITQQELDKLDGVKVSL